ncbi:hypothetical protein RF11_02562 [Thelohanellus kitauei]|uniref:Uncharacterized protein n=1 Tax=Thelohanellus kitauei TaxID=669202 RepID=A0A0C2IFQ8_THEKT|nr:hypothetical protein RF11_02562 [Thelohanellus kitauei]
MTFINHCTLAKDNIVRTDLIRLWFAMMIFLNIPSYTLDEEVYSHRWNETGSGSFAKPYIKIRHGRRCCQGGFKLKKSCLKSSSVISSALKEQKLIKKRLIFVMTPSIYKEEPFTFFQS